MWRALTGVAIMILGALLVGLIWLTSNVLGYLQPVFVPLAVAGIIFAWITRKLRKKRVVPYRYWMPVVSAFLLGFQVLPLGFSEPIYTEEPSYHETLYSFGLAALFAMAAYFFFRPRSGE